MAGRERAIEAQLRSLGYVLRKDKENTLKPLFSLQIKLNLQAQTNYIEFSKTLGHRSYNLLITAGLQGF